MNQFFLLAASAENPIKRLLPNSVEAFYRLLLTQVFFKDIF